LKSSATCCRLSALVVVCFIPALMLLIAIETCWMPTDCCLAIEAIC
jgi:hypothetical protein